MKTENVGKLSTDHHIHQLMYYCLMVNFSPKIEDASDEELKRWVNETAHQFGVLASDELTRRSLKTLTQSVEKNIKVTKSFSEATEEFNKQTSDQGEKMLRLTFVLFTVAFMQIIVSALMLPIPAWAQVLAMTSILAVLGWTLRTITKDLSS